MEFLFVTGMSGAGKSTAVNLLEDVGFYCTDNLPMDLIPEFIELCFKGRSGYKRVALVIDVRAGENIAKLADLLDKFKNENIKYKIMFLDASIEILIHRYKETRRPHPLATEGVSLEEAMEKERQLLFETKERADYYIDTTFLNATKLREYIIKLFQDGQPNRSFMINVVSFGFKYGLPLSSDLVFDVRFLPNPFYEPELRTQTGKDRAVVDYIFKYPQTEELLNMLFPMMRFLIPHYIEEGKASLVVSIGCTGGQHRSVALSEVFANECREMGYNCSVSHRDIFKSIIKSPGYNA